jgi:hypothetical protein
MEMDGKNADRISIERIIVGVTSYAGTIHLQPHFPVPAAPDGYGLPILTVHGEDPTAVGQAIIECAACATPSSAEESDRRLLSICGHRTMKGLMAASRNVLVDGRNGRITYWPTRFAGARRGFLFIDGPEATDRIDGREIGERSLEALAMCR